MEDRRNPLETKRNRWGWIFVAPGILFFSAFSLYPILYAIWTSFHNKKLLSLKPPKFIGLQNWISVLSSQDFWNSVRASAVFCVGVFVPVFLGSLLFALLISSRKKASDSTRWHFYSPLFYLLSSLQACGCSYSILAPGNQFLNTLLGTPGIDHKWLADAAMVQLSTILVYVWKQIGYYTILFWNRNRKDSL